MSKVSYLPSSANDKGLWLTTFAGKLAFYSVLFGLTAAETAAIAADSAALNYMLDCVEWLKGESNKMVNYKNKLLDGDIGSVLGPIPVMGTLPEAPDGVQSGILKRVGKLVQRIKNHPAYTQAIGEDLGIEAHNGLAYTKPVLKITLDANIPVIWWRKGDHTAADIYVDRNDGKGFVFLVTATSSRYEDRYELPVGVNTATWHYKAIYKDNNKQTGEISDIVSITVTRLIA